MMSRTSVWVLSAAVLAAVVALIAWRSSARRNAAEDLEASSESEQPAAETAEPSAGPEEPTGREPQAEAPMPEAPPTFGTAPSVAAPQPATGPIDGGPLADPKIREHAKQLAIPNLAMAIERGDPKSLNALLKFFEEHRAENLISEADLGAAEAAVACLERAPDAQEEAADLLRFGAPSALADSVRKACAVR